MAHKFWPQVPQGMHYAETNRRRCYCWFKRRYKWKNKYGSEFDAVFEVGPRFKNAPRDELRYLCEAIDGELKKMYRDLSGSELPLLIMADTLEAAGALWAASDARQNVDLWFGLLRKIKKLVDERNAEAVRAD